jgi:hypothetical protein
MNQKTAFPQLREQAITLRRAGKSRREIKEILGIGSNVTLNEALKGEPPPPWTWRPNAKDDMRAKARALREQGLGYDRIGAELGVSKSSVSLWVRDMPVPANLSYEECRKRPLKGVRQYWAAERPAREAKRRAIRTAAFQELGELTDREVLIAGAIAYWCEGTKNKPYRRNDRVAFINSDPALIRLFMRFLAIAGIGRERLTCRLYIHDSADVASALRFWLEVTGLRLAQFGRPTIKRHQPTTVRKNTGDDYHGCLRIDVRRGADLYHRIEGWAAAAMADCSAQDEQRSEPWGQKSVSSSL